MSDVSWDSVPPSPAEMGSVRSRFLSEAEGHALAKRVFAVAQGGGLTRVDFLSRWVSSTRWGRNRLIAAMDLRNTDVGIERRINGASGRVTLNQIDDAAIEAAVRRAERMSATDVEILGSDIRQQFTEDILRPPVWNESTFNFTPEAQAETMRMLVASCAKAGVVSSGLLQVLATGLGQFTDAGRQLYYPYTWAQYTVTVRDPSGSGSGWAGIDHHDWSKIDAAALTERAIDTCLRSRNPVRLEPGRYTTILEPQAVCDLIKNEYHGMQLRHTAEEADVHFNSHFEADPDADDGMIPGMSTIGVSKIGERVIDERLSISTDVMDPELCFPPFQNVPMDGGTYYGINSQYGELSFSGKTEWIKNGVLVNLAYDREYAVKKLHQNTSLLGGWGFRMSVTGPEASVDEMIATTKRGVLVSRMSSRPDISSDRNRMRTGYTRDGVWLIENGKIAKPVKNFRYYESPDFILNRVEQVGTPVRVFNPVTEWECGPVICPALKVRDFNFTQLVDAV